MIQTSRKFTIGRSPKCSYQINKSSVSAIHCKIFAVRSTPLPFPLFPLTPYRVTQLLSDTQELHVIVQDLSSNGMLFNDRKVQKNGCVVVRDGDRIEIAGQVFVWRPCDRDVGKGEDVELGKYVVMSKTLGRLVPLSPFPAPSKKIEVWKRQWIIWYRSSRVQHPFSSSSSMQTYSPLAPTRGHCFARGRAAQIDESRSSTFSG